MTSSNILLTESLSDSQIARLVVQVQGTIGLGTDDLASRIGRPAALVAAWEHAETRPNDADMTAMASLCGVTVDALVRRVQALTIDRAMGILHVGGSTAYLHPDQGNDHVLDTYVGLVRNMRMLADEGPVELRGHDLDVLADYLDLDDVALVEQLVRAVQVTHAEAVELRSQLMRRPIIASVAGLLAGSLATFGIAAHTVDDRPNAAPVVAVATAATTATTAEPVPTVWSAPVGSAPTPIVAEAAPLTTDSAATPTNEPLPAPTTTPPADAPTEAAAPTDVEIGDAASETNPDAPVPFSTARP